MRVSVQILSGEGERVESAKTQTFIGCHYNKEMKICRPQHKNMKSERNQSQRCRC